MQHLQTDLKMTIVTFLICYDDQTGIAANTQFNDIPIEALRLICIGFRHLHFTNATFQAIHSTQF